MSPWAHLPSALHIDRVLEHMTKNPTRWDAAWDAAWGAVWDVAWDDAWNAAWKAAWDNNRDNVWNAAWEAAARNTSKDAARIASCGAVTALVAWDDCAYLLDLKPETVRGIVRISDSQAAVLLLPAVIALHLEGA